MSDQTTDPILPATGGVSGTEDAPDSPFLDLDSGEPGSRPEDGPQSRREIAQEIKSTVSDLARQVKEMVVPRSGAEDLDDAGSSSAAATPQDGDAGRGPGAVETEAREHASA